MDTFQSTHPRRVWLCCVRTMWTTCSFQSTHPRRVWRHTGYPWPDRAVSIHTPTQGVTRAVRSLRGAAGVSIHTPTQGVTACRKSTTRGFRFQSTHPRRVWHIPGTASSRQSGFNPHTHAGCDKSSVDSTLNNLVSIHTPTQGVTHGVPGMFPVRGVSIHTPTQGVTSRTRICPSIRMFQSTHPRRVWLSVVSVNKSLSDVSIHTPTQGVTNLKLLFLASWSFNPHTHAGCDSRAKYLDLAIACFNPHTHAGCDFGWVKALSRITGFNPHTHAGCDSGGLVFKIHLKFQSTHPRRVWLYI